MESIGGKDQKGVFSFMVQKIETVVKWVTIISVAVTAIVLIIAVIMRFMKLTFVGADEIALFLLIWITFLGTALSLRNNQLVAVTFVLEKMNIPTTKVLNIIIQVIVLVFSILFLYYSYLWLLSPSVMNTTSAALRISYWIPYSIIPLTSAIFVIFCIDNIKAIIKNN
jgi:TRAP-type C4-dicarboxylate transport system permease small subunit